MSKLTKGEKTKKDIVRRINTLFNEREMFLTWDEIAAELGLSRSRITNYFPKKDLLVLAIYIEFESKLKTTLEAHHSKTYELNLGTLQEYYSSIMDLLYDFRFSISYVLVNPMNDGELSNHIDQTYDKNRGRLFERVKNLVRSGIVDKSLLLKMNFDAFTFQHTTLLTTWVITYRLYDKNLGFDKMKPIYLQGILNCYLPYLTDKGKSEFQLL